MNNNSLSILNGVFKTADALYKAYMPFLQGGGLFVKTNGHYKLGDFLVLNLSLLDDPTVYRVSGKIAWITPQGGQSNKPAGIGVQFIDDTSSYFCNKIETLLGEKRHFSEPTDTL